MLVSPFLRFMEAFYGLFVYLGSNLQSLFLLYMRVTWGHQLFLAGLHKLRDIPGTIELFTKLKTPFPFFDSYLVGWVEVIGGICLVLGFASRLIAIPLVILLITALATAHTAALGHFRFVTEPLTLVIQQPYPFLITAFLMFVFGPGRVSIDAWIKRWITEQPRY